MTNQITDDSETARLDKGLDGMGDVADAMADLRLPDADVEGLLGGLEELGDPRRDGADRHGDGIVADVPVVFDGDIERDDVAFAEDALEGADAVDNLLVDREAGMGREATRTDLITVIRAAGAVTGDQVAPGLVEVEGADARLHERLEAVQHRCGDGTRLAHARDGFPVFDGNHRLGADSDRRGGGRAELQQNPQRAVMFDHRRLGGVRLRQDQGGPGLGAEAAGQGFLAGFEPLVEHAGMEQRSRESFQQESRIGFARPEPLAKDREQGLVGHGGAVLARLRGLPAERRATANLLMHKRFRRDVLYLQRTSLGGQARRQRAGGTEVQ